MKKPILVTGIHKSGTTWVGKILAKSREIGYVYEPFNYGTKRRSPVDRWYQYVSDEVGKVSEFESYLNGYMKFSARHFLSDLLSQAHSSTELYRTLRTHANLLLNKRQLIKDPIAVLSAEWLARRFDMQVLILIRHPAAFVASAKKRNYDFPFEHLLEQEQLMEQYLFPFKDEITRYSTRKMDVISQASLLWKLIYFVVHQYREKYPDWIFLRNEDLSLHPQQKFEELFDSLNIELTPNIKEIIYSSSHSDKSTHTRRDSRDNITSWKKILNQSEVDQVRASVSEVSGYFYQSAEW